jgi:hypothetical protein
MELLREIRHFFLLQSGFGKKRQKGRHREQALTYETYTVFCQSIIIEKRGEGKERENKTR